MITTKEIIDYVMESPHNTNPSVLRSLLSQYSESGSGGDDSPIGPEPVGDGKTRFYISVGPAALTYSIDLALNTGEDVFSSVTIDWGDGTVIIHDDAAEISHVYSEPGDYVITLTVTSGSITLMGDINNDIASIHRSVSDPDEENSTCCVTAVEIGEGVVIGSYAFCVCSYLKSVIIPSSVVSIGEGAFDSCSALDSLTISNGVTNIEDNAFSRCYSLRSVIIPSSVVSIGEYAFYSCKSLRSVAIPSNVISIGEGAFAECEALDLVHLPSGRINTQNTVGNYAFQQTRGLRSIVLDNLVPPDWDPNVVFGLSYNIIPMIYVLYGSKERYITSSYWSPYADRIVEMDPPGPEEVYTTVGEQYTLDKTWNELNDLYTSGKLIKILNYQFSENAYVAYVRHYQGDGEDSYYVDVYYDGSGDHYLTNTPDGYPHSIG